MAAESWRVFREKCLGFTNNGVLGVGCRGESERRECCHQWQGNRAVTKDLASPAFREQMCVCSAQFIRRGPVCDGIATGLKQQQWFNAPFLSVGLEFSTHQSEAQIG